MKTIKNLTAEQIRKSILQLAIQGKLVKQNPNDEPASVLVDKIYEEKKRLIAEGKIKKEKVESRIFKGDDNRYYEKIGNVTKDITDELPFDIPDSWEWIRHNSIFEIFGGSQPPKNKFINNFKEGYIRLYQIRDYGENPCPVYIPLKYANKTTKKGDILLARYGASVGKVFFAQEGAYNVAMAKVEKLFINEHIDKNFLYCYYKSNIYQMLVLNNSRSAQAGFNKGDLNSLFLPIPPLTEQQRIVEKIKSFEPLLEKYNQLENKLTKLETELPDKLKKSILQYAIEGKLVKQDPNDEPANVLLEKIRAEKKAKLGKKYVDSYIYKGDDNCYYEKVGDEVKNITDILPFKIPNSWSWARLDNLCDYAHRGKSPVYGTEQILPIIAQKCNQWDSIHVDRCLFAEKETIENYTPEQFLQPDDIIMNSTGTGTVGRTGLVDQNLFTNFPKFVADSHITVIRPNVTCSSKYIYLFLISAAIQTDIESKCSGSTNQIELATKTICNFLISIPPLKEQTRIVERIEVLFSNLKDEV